MLSRVLLVLFLLLHFAPQTATSAQKICIAGVQSKIPAAAEKAIRKTGEVSRECKLVGAFINLKDENSVGKDVIATTDDTCEWAASAGPVWILKNEGNKYEVVLNFVTYDLEVLNKKINGLRNIKTSRGTAGTAEVEFWTYTGKMYKKTASYHFSADDEKTCKAHPDICPFRF